jgi:hypothetical protein|tara:strand:+ start:487 stop:615 length:129 start_codon:yes stop_codon:yes gene_type:complete
VQVATFWHSFTALAARYFGTNIVQNIGGAKHRRKIFVIFMFV